MPPCVLRRLAARLPARFPLLLESAGTGPLSRMSALLAEPTAALWVDAAGHLGAEGVVPERAGFLGALESWWRRERAPPPTGSAEPALPFTGGWAVFLGYEMAEEIEPHLRLPPTPLPWRAFALRTPCALVHDRERQRVYAVAEAGARAALERVVDAAQAAADTADPAQPLRIARVREEPAALFLARVRR
ncbi:MAG: aminodeoxychorismate synthase, component I, partial [Gammaproteobacteria bacterium]|nr:aminodeoxychorismate synthase, component I [Gammaproteobacteria bacterium]